MTDRHRCRVTLWFVCLIRMTVPWHFVFRPWGKLSLLHSLRSQPREAPHGFLLLLTAYYICPSGQVLAVCSGATFQLGVVVVRGVRNHVGLCSWTFDCQMLLLFYSLSTSMVLGQVRTVRQHDRKLVFKAWLFGYVLCNEPSAFARFLSCWPARLYQCVDSMTTINLPPCMMNKLLSTTRTAWYGNDQWSCWMLRTGELDLQAPALKS